MKTSLRSATILAILTACISGVSNFVAKIAVTGMKDAVLFTTIKNALVGLLLAGVIITLRKWPEIRSLNKAQWKKLAAIGIVGGSVPFALFFTGLTMTSAINASLIHKSLFIWVALLAIPLLKESLRPLQWVGIGALFIANILPGGFTGFRYNAGELMILGATLLWAVENIIAKRALADISSTVLAASRMIFGSFVLLAFILGKGTPAGAFYLSTANWGWVLLSSALLFGYVTAWYAALKRAPATYVAALLVPATLVTNVLSAVFVTHTVSARDAVTSSLYLIGVILVFSFARFAPIAQKQSPASA